MAARRTRGDRLALNAGRPSWCVAALLSLAACGGSESLPAGEQSATDPPGPDCQILMQAAQRAAPCDPTLTPLAEAIGSSPDEPRCRREARRILSPGRPVRVASLYEPGWPDVTEPLTDEERRDLLEFPLPATLRIKPDLPPAPGRPLTSARLNDAPLDRADDGTITAFVPPGQYDLTLRHADETRTHCVELEACKNVVVTAHGAQLARDDSVRDGPCETPSVAVTP